MQLIVQALQLHMWPPLVVSLTKLMTVYIYGIILTGNVETLRLFASKFKRLLHEKSADGQYTVHIIYLLCNYVFYFLASGTTPVYFAAQEGRLEALRFLHDNAKCDLNVPSGDQIDHLKPIHAAAQAGHTHVVKVTSLMLLSDNFI